MRHTDSAFAELIRVMRKQHPIKLSIKLCVASPDVIPFLMQRGNTAVLCAYRQEVSQFNEKALLTKFALPLIHAVNPGGSGGSCPELNDYFHDNGANMLPLVAVGAKVGVLANISAASSVANSSPGTVPS